MSNYTKATSDLLVGDFKIKPTGLSDLIRVMSDSGYAINVVPEQDRYDDWYRIIVTEAKGDFYK
jgi:hypothetical protein